MEARTVSKGLAWFSLGLGIAELVAGRQIGKTLGAENRTGVIRGFGAREIVAGLGILQAPAHSTRVWNRVAGDALDLAALGGLLRGGNPSARWVCGAIGAVAGVTLADILTARSLGQVPDTEQGKVGPRGASGRPKAWAGEKTEAVEFEPDFELDQATQEVTFEADPKLEAAASLAN
jgi:hypothetical protein